MEAFRLLKYWRNTSTTSAAAAAAGSGGGPTLLLDAGADATSTLLLDAGADASSTLLLNGDANATPTLLLDAGANATSTLQSHAHDGGPFFDLEFTLPHEINDKQTHTSTQEMMMMTMIMDQYPYHQNIQEQHEQECDDSDGDNVDKDGEFEFALSSCSSAGDANVADPSDDLFFKGTPVSIDTINASQHHAKSQFLHKSATKFRILMLKFKKSKSKAASKSVATAAATANQQTQQQQKQECLNQPARKFLTVKFKVEDVPIMSLFSRDSSNSQKQIGREVPSPSPSPSSSDSDSALSSASDEKRFSSKDLMQRYLNKVKPLYVRASRRYRDKPKFPGQLTMVRSANTPPLPTSSSEEKNSHSPAAVQEVNAKGGKQGNLQAGLRVVHKHLGKSRSASSATPCGTVTSKRRDDSLLEQQDGIQGAILHCKRSFNASRDLASSSFFCRSMSYPAAMPPGEVDGIISNEYVGKAGQ